MKNNVAKTSPHLRVVGKDEEKYYIPTPNLSEAELTTIFNSANDLERASAMIANAAAQKQKDIIRRTIKQLELNDQKSAWLKEAEEKDGHEGIFKAIKKIILSNI